MPTAVQCVCYGKIPQTLHRTTVDGVEVGCITLNPWVLQTAYYSYWQHYGENAIEGAINEYRGCDQCYRGCNE